MAGIEASSMAAPVIRAGLKELRAEIALPSTAGWA